MQKKETTKSVCLKLSLEDYKQLETKASQRNLDKTNYLRHLIYRDQEDLYSVHASSALQQISSCAENIIACRDRDDLDIESICEWCDLMVGGVKALWRCFR
ncbi:hypothetical protein [[Ruminococcus] lactaris]|uniref:hypothetical protein n=1 Tax=[Ruminococcus] lactaris TaxID=46228 RepID=UPI00242017B1|nr:hypothetical protein [[Ruminococcus] lactaris]